MVKINPKAKEISGEELFGDYGSPEVQEMLYRQRNTPAAPKDKFAGIKNFFAKVSRVLKGETPAAPAAPKSEPPTPPKPQ